MIGRLKDLTFTRTGEQIISLSVRSDFSEMFDELKDSDVNIEIKKYHKRRSLDANAYAWVLIDKLASTLRMDKDDVYREAIRSIGGVSETVCVIDSAVERLCKGWKHNGLGWFTEVFPSKIKGCSNVILYYGSSTYDTKQMGDLIDHLIQDCQAVGIETATPDDIANLKSLWDSDPKKGKA